MRLIGCVVLSIVALAGCAPPATPETLVYVTKGGTKYHRRECRLKSGSHSIKLGELPAKYSPCSVCKPPILKQR